MKFGAEPKKLAVLGVLLVTAGIIYWVNRDDTGGPPHAQRAAPAASSVQTPKTLDLAKAPAPDLLKPAAPGKSRAQRESSQEFRPTLKAKRPEDRPDPTTIDPTLQLSLLTRLKNVKLDGGSVRSLFDFSTPPVPKANDPGKIIPGKKGTEVTSDSVRRATGRTEQTAERRTERSAGGIVDRRSARLVTSVSAREESGAMQAPRRLPPAPAALPASQPVPVMRRAPANRLSRETPPDSLPVR